jgi:hypothetical protein
MDPLASVFPRRQGERYDWRIYPLALSGAFSNTATRLASFIVKGLGSEGFIQLMGRRVSSLASRLLPPIGAADLCNRS